MNSKMQLGVNLSQRLMMNQNLMQVITLLQHATIDLKQQVLNFLERNPLLEANEPELTEETETTAEFASYSANVSRHTYQSPSYSADYIENIAGEVELRSVLLSQTLGCHFNQFEQLIAESIIDSIDDDGYLSMPLCEIRDIIAKENPATDFTDADLERILTVIQHFDPPGIGARDTNECLLLQINRLNATPEEIACAKQVMALDILQTQNYSLHHLSAKTGLSITTLSTGLKIINQLDFHPGRVYQPTGNNEIEPELQLKYINGQWRVCLCDSLLTRLGINADYQKIISKNARNQEYKLLLEQLQEAKLILSGIKKRNETLLNVATYIMKHQTDFIEHGDTHLKPLNLAQVAEALDLHESTVSRATNGKYIDTMHGVFELKKFFSHSVESTIGDYRSSVAVMHMIKQMIDSETSDHVYSDEELVTRLAQQGTQISRRTVAKYRKKMNILSSYQRAQILNLKTAMK